MASKFFSTRIRKMIPASLVLAYFLICLSLLPTIAQTEEPILSPDTSWDLTEIGQLAGFVSSVNSIAFTPNSKYLIASSDDASLRVWDVERRVQLQELFPHNTYIKDIAISPDGTRLVSVSWDRQVIIYSVGEDGFLVQLETITGFIAVIDQVVFLADSKRIVFGVGDGTLVMLDITNPDERTTVTLNALHIQDIEVASSAENPLIAVLTGFPDESLLIFNDDLTQPPRVIEGYRMNAIALSPMVSDDHAMMVTTGLRDFIFFWNIPLSASEPLPEEYFTHVMTRELSAWYNDLAFSPDGSLLFVSDMNGVVSVWDLITWEKPVGLTSGVAETAIITLATSPDGRMVVTGHDDGIIRLWGRKSK